MPSTSSIAKDFKLPLIVSTIGSFRSHRCSVITAITAAGDRVVALKPDLDGTVESLLLTRENQYGPSIKRMQTLLGRWNVTMKPPVKATVLVTAHNAMLQPMTGDRRPGVCFFTHREGNGWWTGFGKQYVEDAPWIEALCSEDDDDPTLYRIDTAQSRAWDVQTNDEPVPVHRPQVLAFRRSENGKHTPAVLYATEE